MVIRPRCAAVLAAISVLVITGGCSVRHPTFMSEADLEAAAADSISIDAYLALPPDAQAARTMRAEEALVPLNAARAAQDALERRISAPFMFYPYPNYRTLPSLGDVIEHLDRALGLDPSRADVWLERGRLLDLAGDRRRARQSVTTAWRVQARLPDAAGDPARLRRDVAVAAAWIEREDGRWDEGLAWLARARDDIGDDDSEAILLRGLLLAGRGDLEDAMRLSYGLPPVVLPVVDQLGLEGYLGRLTRRNDMLKRWLQAEVWMRRGRSDLAWNALGEVPYWRRVTVLPHRLYQDLGLYAELSGLPYRANLYYALAYVRREYRRSSVPVPLASEPVIAGRPHRDLNFYRLDSGAFHGGSLAAYAMSTAMLALESAGAPGSDRQYLLASDALEVCLRRGIHPDEALAMRGRLRFSRGHYVLAEMDLAEARTRFSARGMVEPWTSYLLGLVVMGRDRPDEAVGYLEESLGADPQRGAAWDALGVARLQLGDRRGARHAFDRAVATDPRSASARFNRGLLRSQEGDLDGALADFEAAAGINPGDPRIARVIQLAQLARREGRPFMLGLDDRGAWVPAGVDLHVHEDGAFAPRAVAGREAWRERVGDLLDEVLAEVGAAARADGLDAAALAELVAAYEAEPTPARRKLLAHAFVWLDLPGEARALLAPHWGRDLDDDELLLLLWLDQRAGEDARLRQLAHEMGRELSVEVGRFEWAALVSRILDDWRDPKFGRQRTFARYDAKHVRSTSYGAHWGQWLQRQREIIANAGGDLDGNLLVHPRGRAYRIPDGGSNHGVGSSRGKPVGGVGR